MRQPNFSHRAATLIATVFLSIFTSGCGVPTDDSQPVTKKSGESDGKIPEPKWHTNLDEAMSEAKSSGKHLLVDFTGSDWCHWCIVLKKEVFDQPEFKRWAHKNVVLVELDFPQTISQPEDIKRQNDQLQRRYGVRGFPTVLFLDSTGAAFGRSGYMEGGPKNWIAGANKILATRKVANSPN